MSSVASMHDFKKFLFQTEGEALYLFWMDVEHLKCHQSQFYIRKMIIRISQTYIADSSPFQLSSALRDELVSVQKSDEPQNRWNTKQQIKELVRCQSQVLQCLREYWCKRYALVKVKELDGESVEPEKKEAVLKRPQSSHGTSEFALKSPVEVPESKSEHLPSVDSSESVSKNVTRRVSHIKISTSKIPYLFSGEKSNIIESVSNDTLAQATILSRGVPNSLLSSSAYSLFSSSSSLLRLDLSQKKNDNSHLEPFLCATLRADFTAGNPFLHYLKATQPSSEAVNYLLFWQSVENILTQDEMRRWYTQWCLRNLKKEDKLSPYMSYFEPYFVAKNLQELCLFFLQPKSIHKVNLPQDVQEELGVLLPRGLGQGLLLAAQDHAIKVSQRLNSITTI